MSVSGTHGPGPRRTILIGLLALVVGAGLIVFQSNSGDEADNPAGRAESLWYCPDCQHAMPKSGEVEIAYQRSAAAPATGAPGPRKARDGIPVTKCDRCAKWTARAATKCTKCGAVFPSRSDDGKRAPCPKCGPSSAPNQLPEHPNEQKPVTPAY